MKKALILMGILVLTTCLSTTAQADIRDFWFPRDQIHYAVLANDQNTVSALLKANPECLNSQQWTKGKTPLMLAAEKGNIEIVEILLKAGADVNMRSRGRFTALHYAVENGHTDIALLLWHYGANPNKPDKSGFTPYAMAYYYHNDLLIQTWQTSAIARH